MAARLFEAPVVAGVTVGTTGDSSEVLRSEGIDAWVLQLHRRGRCQIRQRGAPCFTAVPGDLVLIPPGVPHDYGADPAAGHWDHRWIVFFPRPTWHGLLAWPDAGAGTMRLHADGAERQRLDRLVDELTATLSLPWRRRFDLAQCLVEQALWWCDRLNPTSDDARLDPRVRLALELLAEHLADRWTIASLARRVGLSPSRLAHLFKAQVGEPPLAWLERRRIERAGELLAATGGRIAEVAAAVGYGDPLYFSRVFRRRTGRPPRDHRAGR